MPEDSSADERHRGILCCQADKVRELLREQFGVDLDLEFIIKGKRRVFVSKKCDIELKSLHDGIYFGKIEKDGLRLSIEGSFIVGRLARKGVVEVNEEQAMKWLKGEELEIPYKGYCIIKWGEYFLGCGKGNGKKILNFVPKDRRMREK
uniref:rRNA small subunit methyltransferase F RNA-binding PUA-like domain-containing protein n=1 Tax=Archaeoglobus fulgidus TaxID=2234 RepID=A0A7J2TJI8_ARCFL